MSIGFNSLAEPSWTPFRVPSRPTHLCDANSALSHPREHTLIHLTRPPSILRTALSTTHFDTNGSSIGPRVVTSCLPAWCVLRAVDVEVFSLAAVRRSIRQACETTDHVLRRRFRAPIIALAPSAGFALCFLPSCRFHTANHLLRHILPSLFPHGSLSSSMDFQRNPSKTVNS